MLIKRLFTNMAGYAAAIGVAVLASATPASAQASICYAVAERNPLIHYANFQPQNLGEREVGLTYVGHSTFLIETPAGVTIATDFAGYAGPGITPEVVTMNRAHSTHYTDHPSEDIDHVLRGWNPAGGKADHDIEVDDVRIRNVSTDIRRFGGAQPDGNSIFVFEVAGLCIGHLGHLHHIPTPEQFGELGFLDVVLAPVDGVYTMSLADMIETLETLRARLVVPMHAFSPATLARFVDGMRDNFEIEMLDNHSLVLSDATLPLKPTVRVLPAYVPPRDD